VPKREETLVQHVEYAGVVAGRISISAPSLVIKSKPPAARRTSEVQKANADWRMGLGSMGFVFEFRACIGRKAA
jgi:hypothetical protein